MSLAPSLTLRRPLLGLDGRELNVKNWSFPAICHPGLDPGSTATLRSGTPDQVRGDGNGDGAAGAKAGAPMIGAAGAGAAGTAPLPQNSGPQMKKGPGDAEALSLFRWD